MILKQSQICFQSSFKRVHLTHYHHMIGDKNPIMIPKSEYTLAYEELTNPPNSGNLMA